MATKKEDTHESLMAAIEAASDNLDNLKSEYKAFCKANPLELPKQLTAHEIRMMSKKNKGNVDSLEKHQKVNSMMAVSAQKEQLKREIKTELVRG